MTPRQLTTTALILATLAVLLVAVESCCAQEIVQGQPGPEFVAGKWRTVDWDPRTQITTDLNTGEQFRGQFVAGGTVWTPVQIYTPPGVWTAYRRPTPLGDWLFGPVWIWQPLPQQRPHQCPPRQ